jgi:hypothetical protein
MDHIADDGEFRVNGRKNLRFNARGSGNTRTAPTEFFASRFQVLGFQRAPSALSIEGGPFVVIAVERVSVDPGLDVLE